MENCSHARNERATLLELAIGCCAVVVDRKRKEKATRRLHSHLLSPFAPAPLSTQKQGYSISALWSKENLFQIPLI